VRCITGASTALLVNPRQVDGLACAAHDPRQVGIRAGVLGMTEPHPLPSGTVAFLFTDIAGSTRLWHAHRAAMERAYARHDAHLCRAIGVAHRARLTWFWPILICMGVSNRRTRASDSLALSSCRFVCSQRLA
jgi:hypothetical protein